MLMQRDRKCRKRKSSRNLFRRPYRCRHPRRPLPIAPAERRRMPDTENEGGADAVWIDAIWSLFALERYDLSATFIRPECMIPQFLPERQDELRLDAFNGLVKRLLPPVPLQLRRPLSWATS